MKTKEKKSYLFDLLSISGIKGLVGISRNADFLHDETKHCIITYMYDVR